MTGPSHHTIRAAISRRGAPGNVSVATANLGAKSATRSLLPACDGGGAAPLGAPPRPGQRTVIGADPGRGDTEGGM